MIRLALIAVSFIALSSSVHAEEYEFPKYARMISLEQLQRLEPERRDAYMEGLRLLLLEMEMMQERRAKIDPALRKRVNAHFELLEKFFPRAEAEPSICRGPSLFTYSVARQIACGTTKMSAPKACPVPSVMGYDSLTFRGARQSDWERMSRNYEQRRRATAEGRSPRGRSVGRDRNRSPASRAVAGAVAAGGGIGAFAAAVAARTESDYSKVDPVQVCLGEAASVAPRTGLVCNRQTIEEGRANFTGEKQCIYAGHLREYKNRSAQPGQCKPIHEWCLNESDPEDCRNPIDPAQRAVSVFRCSPSQVLCNPLLFGVKKTNAEGRAFQAFCVPKGGAATKACYDQMTAADDSRVDLVRELAQNNSSPRATYMGSLRPEDRQALDQQLRQLPVLWERLATGLSDMCIRDPASIKVFCEECHYIRLRLQQIGFLATQEPSSLCGATVKGAKVTENDKTPSVPTVTAEEATATQDVPVPATDPNQVAGQSQPAPTTDGAASQ